MSENNDNAVQTPDISEEYLSTFRQCLRITSTDFDGEIADLIRAARSDLVLGGVWETRVRDEADPLIRRAITSYIRAEFALINEEKTVDGDGCKITRETQRAVYINKKSATRSEFYTAKQAGDKIALVLEVPGADYHGETRVAHEGRRYEVVRTYTQNGEKYELNCKQAMKPPLDGADGEETA